MAVWVRGAAIRPVPAYAVIPAHAFAHLEADLASRANDVQEVLDRAFDRFEQAQPELAALLEKNVARPFDSTAVALGYYLAVAIWFAFDRSFKGRLRTVTTDEAKAAEDALTFEEELRASHAEEPLDLDDIVAIEQPNVLAFVQNHVEAALEVGSSAEGGDVDVDDVHAVYRVLLTLIVALSHAVDPEDGASPLKNTHEILA